MKNRYLCIIQARITSSRLPNKVMQTVGGIPMVKRVWLAARASRADKTVIAWPERYPDLDESNVLERFRRIANEFPTYGHIIRLTADCPLISKEDINEAVSKYEATGSYYSNHTDGFDVQVFTRQLLMSNDMTHREHVIADFTTKNTGYSVNTQEDLDRVRMLCKAR